MLMIIRPQIAQLVKLGPFPPSQDVDLGRIKAQQELLEAIKSPVSEHEAKQLVTLFGPDDYYGLAWTLLHLVESTPRWPIQECLSNTKNEWINRLIARNKTNPSEVEEVN